MSPDGDPSDSRSGSDTGSRSDASSGSEAPSGPETHTGSASRPESDDSSWPGSNPEREPRSGSPVVTKTVRAVSPFVLTFGLFVVLHGTKSAGGGFQGGVIVASVVVTLAFVFGIRQTAAALGRQPLVWGAASGVVLFGAVAAGSALTGGAFLEPSQYPVPTAYPVELVEVGIGVTVASIVTLLFLELAGRGRETDDVG